MTRNSARPRNKSESLSVIRDRLAWECMQTINTGTRSPYIDGLALAIELMTGRPLNDPNINEEGDQ